MEILNEKKSMGWIVLKKVTPNEYELMNNLTEKQWEGCFEDEKFNSIY